MVECTTLDDPFNRVMERNKDQSQLLSRANDGAIFQEGMQEEQFQGKQEA